VGSAREVEVDVRVIAATNRDPEEAVFEGQLRADLFHRLNVFPLELPSLSERGNDIQLLAQHFLDDMNARAGSRTRFSAAVSEALFEHPWPGNVRELKNYVQRALIMATSGEIDTPPIPVPTSAARGAAAALAITVPVGTSLDSANRELIFATLEQCDGVKTRAAEILGISLKTLYNRLSQYEMQVSGQLSAEDSGPIGGAAGLGEAVRGKPLA
jgi:DNA-binding NtrC family response regulator